MLPRLILLILTAAFIPVLTARAGEIQVRTTDGQTIQGEYLGTTNNVVKIRTKFGVVSIPSKDVVTMNAVTGAKTEGGDETGAKPDDEKLPQTFPELKAPNVPALVASRSERGREPTNRARLEINRDVEAFADTTDSLRQKYLRNLQSYGDMAIPFISAAYNAPIDTDVKVDLLHVLAVPGRHLATLAFADTHRALMNGMSDTGTAPPPPPPDYVPRRDRNRPRGRAEVLRELAGFAVTVEGYASTAGGPFNALFLLGVYKDRYNGESDNPLLKNIIRDKARMAATATNAKTGATAWAGEDRVMLCEHMFPLMFKENGELKDIAVEFLKKILPATHPKWTAPQDEWVEWWAENKAKVAK